MTSPERRRFQRIATDKPASLSVAGSEFPCQVLDISLHGILLDCADAIAVSAIGEPASARVRLDDAGLGIRFEGTVIHADGSHLGIESRQMDLESAARLRRLVELNLADERLLERELGELVAGQAD
jgi:hypothetical protein